ncbi:zinc-binding dehydrogenase [Colletotrichum truncatum]|uniref:Zinc-binding dehydrogenase n=1 Tax=Colletotrichum truncatum TaxID=5467 RepID=A0ACC3ZAZ3_COLTU
MKAIVVTAPGEAGLVHDRPKPAIRDGYMLVKTQSIALNPTDWKHAALTQTPGILLGCDYAGVVEEVGANVTKPFAKGDRVMGFVHGGNSNEPEDGAFAEYIMVKGDIQAHVPDGMSFEEAATFGVGITAVGQGLYQALGLPLPPAPDHYDQAVDETSPRGPRDPILIYGGATASGVLGLQCTALSGFRPLATCSPHNAELVAGFGADEVYDYGDGEDAAEDIRAATGDGLRLCWDTVSTAWTVRFCAAALSSRGGKLATLQPVRSPASGVLECVDTKAYTVFGEAWGMGAQQFPAMPGDWEFGKRWWSLAERLIAHGKIRPHKIQVGPRGLEGALEGLAALRDSKVSGYKLVYRVSETP